MIYICTYIEKIIGYKWNNFFIQEISRRVFVVIFFCKLIKKILKFKFSAVIKSYHIGLNERFVFAWVLQNKYYKNSNCAVHFEY